MKRIVGCGASALILGMLSTAAHAAPLFTGAVIARPFEKVACSVVNVGLAPQRLEVELFDGPKSAFGFPVICDQAPFGGDCFQQAIFPAGATHVVSCQVRGGAKATLRGMIGNLSTGQSSEAK